MCTIAQVKEFPHSIQLAAEQGNEAVIRLLQEEQARTMPKGKAVIEENHTKALFTAVANNDLKTVEQLISNGASIHVRNKAKRTLLHEAISKQHHDMADYLLKTGIAKQATDNQGNTPLHLATSANDLEMVKVLFRYAVVPDQPNSISNDTALHIAAGRGYLPIVKELLSQRAHIDARNKGHESPIALAYSNNHIDTVQYLYKQGAAASSGLLVDYKKKGGYIT